jgi:preprotein translocase SecE subunit
MSNFWGKMRAFFTETMVEINKCTWPKRAELFDTTILTIVVIVLLTAFVFLTDQLSIFLIKYITML